MEILPKTIRRERSIPTKYLVLALWLSLSSPFASFAGAQFHQAKPSSAIVRSAVPLSFEANQGQTDRVVKFLSRGDGYALFLTPSEAVFKLRKAAAADKAPSVLRMKLVGADGRAKISGTERQSGIANYFVGNDPKKWRTGVSTYGRVSYRGIYPGVDAVFYGNQRELEYDLTVAPGANPRQIVLEFSGARPKLNRDGDLVLTLDGERILLHKPVIYQGAGAGKRAVDGSYALAGNRVNFQIGRYDRSQPLVIDPVLSYLTYLGGTNADNIGSSTGYYPSGETNPTQGLAIDASGNVYVTGYTCSADFPVQVPYQSTAKESVLAQPGHFFSVFVSKLNSTGTALVYSTYLGGTGSERGTAIAVDSSGSAYVGGYTGSSDFPVTPGAYMTRCNGGSCYYAGPYDGFLTKLSPDGKSLVYSTYLGGQSNHNSEIYAVAVDSKGQAYVAGDTNDSCWSYTSTYCFPTTKGAVIAGGIYDAGNYATSQAQYVNNYGSAFVTVFDAAGASLLYSTLFCDANPVAHVPLNAEFETNATGVAVDALGNFYLVGTTKDAYLPTTSGAFQPTFPTASGVTALGYVAKFSPVSSPGGSSLVYASYLGGTDKTAYAQAAGVAADASGNAYVTGITASSVFPVTPGAYQTTCGVGCGSMGFVTKIKPDGSGLVWSTMLGNLTNAASGGYYGPVNAIGGIQVDASGNVYVAGQSAIGFPEVNPIQTTTGGGAQAFVAKFDPTGRTLLFSSLVGGGGTLGSQGAAGLAVDGQGNIYLAGNTDSGSLSVMPGAFQRAFGKSTGVGAGFIAKILVSAPQISLAGIGDAANYVAGKVAPGEIIVVYGSSFGPASLAQLQYANGVATTTLGNTRVYFDNVAAPMIYAVAGSPGVLSCVVPYGVAGKTSTQVQVEYNGVKGNALTVPVVDAVPAIFSLNQSGTGPGAILNWPDYSVNGVSNRVAAGGYIMAYATGEGKTDIATDGQKVPLLGPYPKPLLGPWTATVGGKPAAVTYSGSAPDNIAGVFQVNIQIPTDLTAGIYDVVIKAGTFSSTAGVTVAVK